MVVVGRCRSERYRCAIVVCAATRSTVDGQRVLVDGLRERCTIGSITRYGCQRRNPLIERIGVLRCVSLGWRSRSGHYAVVERLVRDLLVVVIQISDSVRTQCAGVSSRIYCVSRSSYYLGRPTCERVGVLRCSVLGRCCAGVGRNGIFFYIRQCLQHRAVFVLEGDGIGRCHISRRTHLQTEHTNTYLTTSCKDITTTCQIFCLNHRTSSSASVYCSYINT